MDKEIILKILISLKNTDDTNYLEFKKQLGNFLFENSISKENEQLYEEANIIADEILNMIEMMKEK